VSGSNNLQKAALSQSNIPFDVVVRMKFTGDLDSNTRLRVDLCDSNLLNPDRLSAIELTGLMDSEKDLAFNRLADLAAKLLEVPLTIISLVGEEKQFFVAAHGLPPAYEESRTVPISDSICRYTLNRQTIIAADASADPLLKHHPTIGPWGIGAFMAIPMQLENGHVLGAFCAVDIKPRPWLEQDILILQELTASVMTEINLRMQIRELKTEKELREKTMIALSHDLRNPLSIAKMGAEVLGYGETSPEDKENLLSMISKNIDRADQMIQDLLTSSRFRAGESIPLDMTNSDLVEIVRSTVDSLKKVHKKEFHLEIDGEISGQWDGDRIRRIIENLAGNAVKYGDPSQRILVSLAIHAEGIEISVNNRGPVIPQAELDNLFALFHRSESAKVGSQKGWGIGLTVVRGLSQEMGGYVRVESNADHGTTFCVIIPNR
jgi:signal transduction histidine kinase